MPGKILELWIEDRFSLVISEDIYAGYKRVSSILQNKYSVTNIDSILNLVAINAHFVDPKGADFPHCADPDDDKFLAAAVTAKTNYLVSSDKALIRCWKL